MLRRGDGVPSIHVVAELASRRRWRSRGPPAHGHPAQVGASRSGLQYRRRRGLRCRRFQPWCDHQIGCSQRALYRDDGVTPSTQSNQPARRRLSDATTPSPAPRAIEPVALSVRPGLVSVVRGGSGRRPSDIATPPANPIEASRPCVAAASKVDPMNQLRVGGRVSRTVVRRRAFQRGTRSGVSIVGSKCGVPCCSRCRSSSRDGFT